MSYPGSNAHAAPILSPSEPPHNCAIYMQHEEEEMRAQGHVMHRTGSVTSVAIHAFHIGDFALLRAEGV